MNYIKKLQLAVGEAQATLNMINQEVENLYAYLMSGKFHKDTTVQVQDIFNRTAMIRALANTDIARLHSFVRVSDRGATAYIKEDKGGKYKWESDKHQGSGGRHYGTLAELITYLQEGEGLFLYEIQLQERQRG